MMDNLSSTLDCLAGCARRRLLPGLLLLASTALAAEFTIERVDPTPPFPKPAADQP